MVRVKICCIASLAEASLAIEAGAWAVGLVSEMPSGPGVIGDDAIAEIAAGVAGRAERFVLTALGDGAGIAGRSWASAADALQLVDGVDADEIAGLRERLPGASLVQVVHVRGPGAVEESRRAAPLVDALLLDSGNPDLAVKELGGTGRTHDWAISRAIVEASPVPVFLAGGLTPDNVARAIEIVRPWGVDVCSGVRTDGALDEAKLGRFMAAAAAADRAGAV